MEITHKGYTLVLIDEPTQIQVTQWEQAARALRNEDAKPMLNRIMVELKRVNVTQNADSLVSILSIVSQSLDAALQIINDNEALTLSANDAVMVKAAIKAGWIVSPILSDEDIDNMRPAWRVHWIAEQVASMYMEATTIPKN